jgi:hypothetical protein
MLERFVFFFELYETGALIISSDGQLALRQLPINWDDPLAYTILTYLEKKAIRQIVSQAVRSQFEAIGNVPQAALLLPFLSSLLHFLHAQTTLLSFLPSPPLPLHPPPALLSLFLDLLYPSIFSH